MMCYANTYLIYKIKFSTGCYMPSSTWEGQTWSDTAAGQEQVPEDNVHLPWQSGCLEV